MSLWGIIVRWIHLCSIAVWVGGILFIVAVLRPSFRRNPDQPYPKNLLEFISKRFKIIIIILFATIIASGVINFFFLHKPQHTALYVVLLIFKIILSVGMIGFYFYNAYLIPAKQPQQIAEEALPETEKQEIAHEIQFLINPSKNQAKLQLGIIAISFIVILLGMILREL